MGSLRDASLLTEHQRSAIRQIERMLDRYGGALLADEPGLGKSFIGAAVAAAEEGNGALVEVIAPASLLPQWRRTLRGFGVGARVLSHDGLLSDCTLPEPGRRLLVIDEAHAFRNAKTQRYQALARRSAGARMLLITATPVCNSVRDLQSLLALLVADDSLMEAGVPSIDLAFEHRRWHLLEIMLEALIIRRDRSILPVHLRFGELRRRVVRHEVPEVASLIRALRFPLVEDSALLHDFLLRRLESSEAALLESLRRQRRFYERALECRAAGRTLPKSDYRRLFSRDEDAAAYQTVLFWDAFVPRQEQVDVAMVEEEMARLDELGRRLAATSGKRELLLELCAARDAPMLIFTGWAATALDLAQALRARRRVACATGRERSRAARSIDDFSEGRADVLIATDLAAEGLNLQRAATVVHYDLPWNPVKLDQRNGRAHRIGQRRSSVEAIYFVPRRRETAVMQVLAAKNRLRRRLLRVAGSPPSILDGVGFPPPPRIAAGAAILRFIERIEGAGWHVPPAMLRRHKAGVELLLRAMAAEVPSPRALQEVAALLSFEPWASSAPLHFPKR